MWNKSKTLWLPILLLTTAAGYGEAGVSPGDAVLGSYAEMQYSQARKLAAKDPDLPESQLVKALCAVFDRRKQDLAYGLPELKRLYEDRSLRPELRMQSGLAYARAAQTLQFRPGVYPEAELIAYDKVYDEIISGNPNTPEACYAAVYQAQGWFDSKDEDKTDRAFAKLNSFLKDYKGPKRYLAALNILLADHHIICGRRYDQAAEYLKMALETGISNPRTRENAAYRLARICDLKLHDRARAGKYYREFLETYPNSSNAPIVERYLKELSADSGGGR